MYVTILQGHTVFVKNVALLCWLNEYTGPNRDRHSERLAQSLPFGTLRLPFQI
jgi:hypothetical protein